MKCPDCKKSMPLVEFHDGLAYHCGEHLFERHLPDGTVQHCCLDMETGDLSWQEPKAG